MRLASFSTLEPNNACTTPVATKLSSDLTAVGMHEDRVVVSPVTLAGGPIVATEAEGARCDEVVDHEVDVREVVVVVGDALAPFERAKLRRYVRQVLVAARAEEGPSEDERALPVVRLVLVALGPVAHDAGRLQGQVFQRGARGGGHEGRRIHDGCPPSTRKTIDAASASADATFGRFRIHARASFMVAPPSKRCSSCST